MFIFVKNLLFKNYFLFYLFKNDNLSLQFNNLKTKVFHKIKSIIPVEKFKIQKKIIQFFKNKFH